MHVWKTATAVAEGAATLVATIGPSSAPSGKVGTAGRAGNYSSAAPPLVRVETPQGVKR